jgi:hypothetical protein
VFPAKNVVAAGVPPRHPCALPLVGATSVMYPPPGERDVAACTGGRSSEPTLTPAAFATAASTLARASASIFCLSTCSCARRASSS